MAIDRQGTGLAILRICLGVFFVFEGVGKIRWFTNPALLANQLAGWAQAVPSGSWSYAFLERVAMPYSSIWARLVPLGELTSGAAMVVVGGARTLAGSIIGPFLLLALPQVLTLIDIPTTIAAAARQLIYGVLLIAFMLFRPQGLAGEKL